MFRSNFNSSSSNYQNNNLNNTSTNQRPNTPLSERKNNHQHSFINNSNHSNSKNQFFQPSKNRDLSHTRNNSDYQLNTFNNNSVITQNNASNKENTYLINPPNPQNNNHHTYNYNYYHQNPKNNKDYQHSTLQILNQKINHLASKVRKNQEAIKNLALVPLGAIDDFGLASKTSSKNRQSRGSSNYQQSFNYQLLSKNIEDLKMEQSKQKEKYDHKLSSLKKIITQTRQQLKKGDKKIQNYSLSKDNGNFSTSEFKFRLENMEFEIKDIFNRIKIQMVKSSQQNIDKFIEITKAQISNLRLQFDERIRNSFEAGNKSFKGQQRKNLSSSIICKLDEKIENNSNKNIWQLFNSSNKIFGGKAITFIVQQHIKISKEKISQHNVELSSQNSTNVINQKIDNINQQDIGCSTINYENMSSYKISETVYHIDSQGYLLDDQKRYLINSQNKQVILNMKEIQVLKDLKILK